MDMQNWPKNEWEDIYNGLQEISRKMENIMINCVDDIDAKQFAQNCYDNIETWMDNCARKGNFKVETLDLTSSKKPIKSDKHFKYDEYFGNIYDSDPSNADYWTREEYNEMVEKARDIFYPAVQKAANACRFTVSDNEAEYVAEKCVRQFFDNTSWVEAVNRPEEYYVNSSKKLIKSSDNRVHSYSFDYIITANVDVEQTDNIILRTLEGIHEIELVGNPGINNTSWSKEEYGITSSHEPIESAMPGREKGIRAIMDEYGCSWEEAEEIMNEEISSGCHGKSKKEKKEEKKPEKIEQTRRARNTESLNNLYGKMF